ncbi:NAD(P)-binding domain-containing protein [Treponema sp. OttesenSCG-928-L16]|nr:NAD(P)-binding domain-containing protein [Treponema sp. OttesenSCG-928-L16]
MAKNTIGFIGLGIMGNPMARCLGKKFPGILAYDADPKKVKAAVSDTVKAAESIRQIGESCSAVFLSLPSTAAVRSVILGEDALVSAMKKGSVIIDTGTTEAGAEKEIAGILKEKGIKYLDAPVSGGEKAAIEGSLSFMVGGDEEVFKACRKYFLAMGASAVRTGDISMGQVAKCVNQIIVGSTFMAIAESFALGTKAGLDPKVLYDAIKGGWAGSKLLDVAAKDMFSRSFKPGGTVDIHWKDLGYALSVSQDLDVPAPITALVHEAFKAARAAGDGKRSQPALVRLWERLLSIEVK